MFYLNPSTVIPGDLVLVWTPFHITLATMPGRQGWGWGTPGHI